MNFVIFTKGFRVATWYDYSNWKKIHWVVIANPFYCGVQIIDVLHPGRANVSKVHSLAAKKLDFFFFFKEIIG